MLKLTDNRKEAEAGKDFLAEARVKIEGVFTDVYQQSAHGEYDTTAEEYMALEREIWQVVDSLLRTSYKNGVLKGGQRRQKK